MDLPSSFILDFKWIGNLNVDLSALLLSEKEKILDEADFVFYSSRNRSIPFDQNKFVSRRQWIEHTNPASLDQSVELLSDDYIDSDELYSDYCSEYLKVSLLKVRPEISKILFMASIYDFDSNFHFGLTEDCQIELLAKGTLAPFASYNMIPIISKVPNAKAIVFAELSRSNHKWCFQIIEESFSEGLQAIVEKYC